jgi:NAD kinase
MKALPRIVLITRPTPLEMMVRRMGTLENAKFYAESRGRNLDWATRAHELQHRAVEAVLAAIPPEQHRTQLSREEFDRFVFNADDVIFAVGQDGLVANIAKYLQGQRVVGFNPDPETVGGQLCRHKPAAAQAILTWINTGRGQFAVENRTLVQALREDGQRLLALNEVFIGHQSHQSAKYTIQARGPEGEPMIERQSSSGVIVSTGTGATGWTASISLQRGIETPLPAPTSRALAWFVREPWPSVGTGTSLNFGLLGESDALTLQSELGEGGVIFGDGIETDYLEFNDGQTVTISVAPETLNLVGAAA